ncbi:MAG: hypothetical protein QXD04_01085 [Candidatus Bathyarchaeia archaeon]|nr:hypothetical protein [Candidatus Bathyarchaeota archaeon]
MRWKPTLLFMLIILQTVQPANSQEMAPLYIEVDRRVEVIGSGLITMNDTFTLRAPEGSRVIIERFDIGALKGFEFERCSFSMLVEGEWRTLEYEEGTGNTIMDARWISLKLPRPFTIDGEANLTIRAQYISYGWITSLGNLHRALIPVYPLLPHNITSFNFSMVLPRGASLAEVFSPVPITNSTEGGVWTLSHQGESLAPLRDETAMVSYQPASGDEQILDYELVRSIRISRWNLEIEDNYVINNRGPTVNYIKLRIPRDSTNIEARDVTGPLTLSYRDNEDHKELQVFPRISIGEGMRMSLWVKYSLPTGGRVEGGWERHMLRYRVDAPTSYLKRGALRIILPEGGSLIGSSPEPDFIKPVSMLSQEAGFELGGLIPGESLEVVVEYNWPILYSALRVAQWLIIAACVIVPIYISRRRRAEERGREEKPRELESYRDIYLDRIALLAELEELQEKFERKEVGREHYERRFGEITRRQGELLRDLRRLRSRLEEKEPGLTKKLEAIDMDEEELRKVESDLRALEAHLRSRRISRGEFERRRRELIRRIRQARIRLEGDVNAL